MLSCFKNLLRHYFKIFKGECTDRLSIKRRAPSLSMSTLHSNHYKSSLTLTCLVGEVI